VELSQEEIVGIGVALNESDLLGAEVDPSRAVAALTFSVLTLPVTGASPKDRRVSILLSSVHHVAAVLLERGTPTLRARDDLAATVIPFELRELLDVVQSFGGSAVYGWEFIDTEPDWETCWAGRLSLDWRGSGPVGPHTLTVFQDDARRFLEVRLWFKDLIVRDPRGQPVPLAEFIAGGRRWWDALHAGDPRTKDAGILPLAPPSTGKGPSTAS